MITLNDLSLAFGGGRHHEGSGRSSSCDSPTEGAPHNTDAVVPDLIVKSRPD